MHKIHEFNVFLLIIVMALVCAAAAGDVRAGAAEGSVTVESLLGKMVDTSWLAVPPVAGERTVQFSSYDRASRLEGGTIVAPFANGDMGHYLRVEGEGPRREWVLAEAKGPGYVSRIWSANPAGELRIYIDGSKTPALAADFARITNGEIEPFKAPFGHDASKGRNLYFPFPFARSIKITTTKGDQYFQVSVTTLPEGTKVESYSQAALRHASSTIEDTRRALMHPAAHNPGVDKPSGLASKVKVLAGQSADLFPESWAQSHPGAIAALWCRIESTVDETEALARTLLTITFDDAEEPQVAVPLGEFFGSGPGINPFESAVHRIRTDGLMVASWYMPFRKSARVSVTNFTGQPITILANLSPDLAAPPKDSMYFHARWRYQDDLPTKKGGGTLDWPALRVSGAPGRFVGLLLDVFNPTSAWWGEGDEKIYVDGERFPSTFGTGTEDYFGYAWGDPHTYTNPFHSQTRCDGPSSKGNTSNIRYQFLDSVPFHKGLGFDIEVWHWEAVRIQYATVAFFYAGPGATIEPGIPDLTARKVYPKPTVRREPGVLEAEDLHVRKKTAGELPNQDMLIFGDAWSAGRQLWWLVREPGARLDLEVPVEKDGTYALWAAFTRAGDYGTIQLSLDGKSLGDPIDLYEPDRKVLHTGALPLGVATLEAGPHVLSLTLTGKNPASTGHLVGMDWLKLAPAPTGSFPEQKIGVKHRR